MTNKYLKKARCGAFNFLCLKDSREKGTNCKLSVAVIHIVSVIVELH